MTQILEGLIEIFKRGIIHRDLKPANILIHNGVLKLADFGFAKKVESFQIDIMSSMAGTPMYMSPQVLQK